MTEGAGGQADAGSPADGVPTGGHDRRDLGSGALVVAMVLTVLALIQPVATTTVRIRSVISTSSSGWFGALTSTGSTPAFGWAVVAGVVALAAATLLRWRRNASPVLAVAAGAWLLATGALILAHTASRAQRVRDVLDAVVPAQVSLHPSAAPWLLVVGGTLGVAAAFAPARQVGVTPSRAEPGVVSWVPFEPRTRS
ncbi:MAG: hypothetical protein ABI181_04770 [Mycobacteriaceae bacterium]